MPDAARLERLQPAAQAVLDPAPRAPLGLYHALTADGDRSPTIACDGRPHDRRQGDHQRQRQRPALRPRRAELVAGPAGPARRSRGAQRQRPRARWPAASPAPGEGRRRRSGSRRPGDGRADVRRPRRPRPRLHPRAAARSPGSCRPSGTGRRSATWATSPRRARCCSSATTAAGTWRRRSRRLPLAFSTYFGVERPLLPARPQPGARLAGRPLPEKFGTMAASHEHAKRALDAGRGGARLPRRRLGGPPPELGGRPRSTSPAARASSGSRSTPDVPIVPVVTVGGQETALFLEPRRLARRSAPARPALRLKVLPISLALPWGLNIGDFLGHVPLPAKITIEVLPPIDLREQFGPEPDVDEVYAHVTRRDAGGPRRARRRAPLPGDRLGDAPERVHRHLRAAEARLGLPAEPDHYLKFMSGVTRWEVDGDKRSGLGARYRMLMRVGSAEVGGLIEIVEWAEPRHGLVVGHGRRPARPLAPARDARRAHAGRAALRLRRRRRAASRAGSRSWSPRPASAGHLRRSLHQLKRQVEQESLRAEARAAPRRARGRRRPARATTSCR